MAPKKKKVKSIQRPRNMKIKKPETLEQNTNIGEGNNQQIVKVIIQQPETKPKKKSKPKPKVDEKKKEAIEELKEAISTYDKVQTEADEMGVKIPKELGISPLSAGEIKNTDDILAFITTIREKTQKIKELEMKKKEPAPAPPPPKPNMFLTPPVGINRAGQFPAFIPVSGNTIQPAPIPQPGGRITPALPPSSRRPVVPQVPQSEIDKELADIERSLNQASSPEELAFEDTLTKIQAGVFTIRDDIQKTYSSQNNKLAPEQIKNYKQRYENRRKDLEKAYVKLPADSQTKLSEAKSSLETVINDVEERLGAIEKASVLPLPSPDDPVPEDPNIPEVDADFEAAVQLLKNYIAQKTSINWSSKIVRALRRIGADDVEVADIQRLSAGFPRRQAVAQFLADVTGGLVPKPSPDPPKPSPPKPDPSSGARQRLINFVNDESINWSMSLLNDLKSLGASLQVQNAVSETLLQDEKRKIIKKYLGLSPSVDPNLKAFNDALSKLNITLSKTEGIYKTASNVQQKTLILNIRGLVDELTKANNKLTLTNQQKVAQQVKSAKDRSNALIKKIQALIDGAGGGGSDANMDAFNQAVSTFNNFYTQTENTYKNSSTEQRVEFIKMLVVLENKVTDASQKLTITQQQKVADTIQEVNSKSVALTQQIQTLIDVSAYNAYTSAVRAFNQVVQQIGATYNSTTFQQLQQMKNELNEADQAVDETFRKMAIQTQNGNRTQKNTNNERYRDLLAKLNAKKTFSVPAGGEPDEDPAVPQPRKPSRFTGSLTQGDDPTAPSQGGLPGSGLRRSLEMGLKF